MKTTRPLLIAITICAVSIITSKANAQVTELGTWEVNGIKLDGKACGSGVDVSGGIRVYKQGATYMADAYASYVNACMFDNITPAVSVSFFDGGTLIASVNVPVDTVPGRGFNQPTARGGKKSVQLPNGHNLTRVDFKFVNTGTNSTAIKTLSPIGPVALP